MVEDQRDEPNVRGGCYGEGAVSLLVDESWKLEFVTAYGIMDIA